MSTPGSTGAETGGTLSNWNVRVLSAVSSLVVASTALVTMLKTLPLSPSCVDSFQAKVTAPGVEKSEAA